MPGMQGGNGEGEMSVLIKGMQMPESCCVCPVNMESCNYGFEYLRDHPELYERRAENCPIVEVPTPHGRLIDADALAKTIAEHVYPVADYFNSRDYGMFWTGGIEKAINEQSTIIEAEG